MAKYNKDDISEIIDDIARYFPPFTIDIEEKNRILNELIIMLAQTELSKEEASEITYDLLNNNIDYAIDIMVDGFDIDYDFKKANYSLFNLLCIDTANVSQYAIDKILLGMSDESMTYEAGDIGNFKRLQRRRDELLKGQEK